MQRKLDVYLWEIRNYAEEIIGDEAVWRIIRDALPPMVRQLTQMFEELDA